MGKASQESLLVTREEFNDPLESLARLGARQRLQAALEAEVTEYLQRPRDERSGVARGSRSGSLPERSIFWAAAR
ncbi:MAG: hypothetical protein HYR56_12720 [Acidobacteria bacterium]|nr:hypothetical protein [Acidobacteriota bacterium]MBI3425480.1 hypothetical protein [Acidobacteriota bacterium]